MKIGYKLNKVIFKLREGDKASSHNECPIGGKWIEKTTDDFFKMNAFAAELSSLKKSKPNVPLQQLEEEAAEIVKNTLPALIIPFILPSRRFEACSM